MSVFAVVPVKDLIGTKSRLSPVVNPAGRAGLTLYMMCRVVEALREAGVAGVGVVSPDPIVLDFARERDAVPVLQQSRGLNPALDEGRAWAMERGAEALLVLPADLPLLVAADVRAVIEEAGTRPGVTISPDANRSGTNALLLRPPDAIPFLFGVGSFKAHCEAVRERGIELRVWENQHLGFDVDTTGDLEKLPERERDS